MPWHLGGPALLSYKELEAYIEHYRKSIEAEKKELDKAKTSRPSTPRKPR